MSGYLAFPPPSERLLEGRVPFASTENLKNSVQPPPTTHDTRPSDEEVQSKLEEQQRRVVAEEKRRKRLERERHEVYLSELAWVRSGGILRDAQGRRDKARTAQMQEEVRLQDEEKRIIERWNTYETRWRNLYASTGVVSWKDIPWPSVVPPDSDADLTVDAITEFIFSTFRVRGINGLRKDRIRSSLLRWHPDKLPAIVARVLDEERHLVEEGIKTVFRCLKQLQDEEKQSA